VKDAVLAYAMISGDTDVPADMRGLRQPQVHLYAFNEIEDLSDLKIAFWDGIFEMVEPAVAEGLRWAIRQLQARKAVVFKVNPPPMRLELVARAAHLITYASELAQSMLTPAGKPKIRGTDDADGFGADGFGADTRMLLALGSSATAQELLSAQVVKANYKTIISDSMRNNVDVLLMPTTSEADTPAVSDWCRKRTGIENGVACEALGPQQDWSDISHVMASTRWTGFANFLGLPAMTLPAGITDKDTGLPRSLQLIAPEWEEHTLARVANALEAAAVAEGSWPQPKRFYSLLDESLDCTTLAKPDNGNWGTCSPDGILKHDQHCRLICDEGYIMFDNRGNNQPRCFDGKLKANVVCKKKPTKKAAKTPSASVTASEPVPTTCDEDCDDEECEDYGEDSEQCRLCRRMCRVASGAERMSTVDEGDCNEVCDDEDCEDYGEDSQQCQLCRYVCTICL
jgi:hypothetical protein